MANPTYSRSSAAPIGVSEEGVIALDLLDAGPHGLVGGTNGSGKSELLRSLLAGLAARIRPGQRRTARPDAAHAALTTPSAAGPETSVSAASRPKIYPCRPPPTAQPSGRCPHALRREVRR
ncbi:FtsK/SpoIIIE domain-containing protein [Pseudonocardia hierapolitana]|uniref:FtsK/SpoIIIE domain-containing protein n=1 Tax=Pseudonocardia hierapolitana TaxID=1128676 RepID=UPI0011BF4AA5